MRKHLLDLEADPRFEVSWVCVGTRNRPLVALPLYRPETDRWPDEAYDPDRALGTGERSSPRDWVLGGGRADLTTGLLVHPGAPASALEAAAAAAVAAAAEEAAAHRRRLALLYVGADGGLLLNAARRVGVEAEASQGSRFVVDDVGDSLASYLEKLPSRHRSVVRRDLRDLADARLVATPVPWIDVLDDACDLIAENHERHGEADHPKLVAQRLRRWLGDEGLDCVAFALRREGVLLAATLGWSYAHVLELYELGLSWELGDRRRLAYTEMLFYAPLRLAWERGLRTLDLALAGEPAKRLRGARAIPLYGLVVRS